MYDFFLYYVDIVSVLYVLFEVYMRKYYYVAMLKLLFCYLLVDPYKIS